MISTKFLIWTFLPAAVLCSQLLAFEKRQSCESVGCGNCCTDDGPLKCYEILDGPEAGTYGCYDHPPGRVIGSAYLTSSVVATASDSALTYSQTASSFAYPSSYAGTCDIGLEACGSGCMSSFDTCCPGGQGSCDAGHTCVTTPDGHDGCCPLGKTCFGVESDHSASSTTALNSGYGSYDPTSSRYAPGPTGSYDVGSYPSPSSSTGSSSGGTLSSGAAPLETSLIGFCLFAIGSFGVLCCL